MILINWYKNNNNIVSRNTEQALFMQEKNMAAEKRGSEIEVENRWHGRELTSRTQWEKSKD